MGNNFSTHIEELKAKERQIILISGVKLKSRDVLKTIDKLEAECPNVEEIHVTACRLKVIPPNIVGLKQLEILNCDNNKLSKVPYSLDKHTTLRELILSNNQFVEFPREILSIPSLTSISLSNNHLEWFPELSNLKMVLQSIKEIKLDSNSLQKFPVQLCSLGTLTSLSLSNNKLSSLPNEISQLTSLHTLVLANNNFTTFPEVLYQLPSLISLNMSSNQISSLPNVPIESDGSPIPVPFITLEMKHNRISSFSESLCNMHSLAILKLNDNKISSISEHISQLTKLRELNLAENEIEQIPLTIGHCTNLKKLYLEFNNLKFVPPEITNLINLVVLIMHHNSLTHLPWELKQMVHLLTLSLDDNPFEDEELRVLIKTEGSMAVVFSTNERTKGSKSANSSPTISRKLSSVKEVPAIMNTVTNNSPKSPNKIYRARSKSHENLAMTDPLARWSASLSKLAPLAEETPARTPIPDLKSRRRHSGQFLVMPTQFLSSSASISPMSSREASPRAPSRESSRESLNSSREMSPRSVSANNSPPQSPPYLSPDLLPDPSNSPFQAWQFGPSSPQAPISPSKKRTGSFSLRLTRTKSETEDDDKIPPYSTFKAAFETLLDEQDFSRKRRGFMEDLSKEDKWSMIAQYKWDTLDMLKKGTAAEKKGSSSSAQFFTLRRNVPKGFVRSPKEYCNALSGIMLPPVPIIKDLYEMLNTGGSNAVEFMDIGGISLVVELLSKLFKLTGYNDMVLALMQCMEVLVELGLSSVLTTLESVSVITVYLSFGMNAVTHIVQNIIIEILHLYNVGYKVISEALVANRHSERVTSAYEPFVKILQDGNDLATLEQTLKILSYLIENSGSLEASFGIECELHKLNIKSSFQQIKKSPILQTPVDNLENLFAQHMKEMTAYYGRKEVMIRMGQSLVHREDAITVSLSVDEECVVIPINKATTCLDVMAVILKKHPDYSSKNIEWGLVKTDYSLTNEPTITWLELSKTLVSMRVTSDDVLDFKMRRLFVNVTLKPDVLMPAAVEVDPAMLVIDATRMIVGKFQLSKKRKSGQEEYWNEYGMFLYEKGKYESGAWLDETMPIGDFDFYKQLVGLRLKKNTLNIHFGKMQQSLSFDPDLEIHQIRDQIYNFVVSNKDCSFGADKYGLYMEYPIFMNKPAEWLANNKKLKGYYIPKECIVKLLRKPVPAIVKVGLVGQPTQKATIDIGNRVEDEILKLSELVPVPDEFDVFIAKEGHSDLVDAIQLTLALSFREQKVTEGATMYIKPIIREDVYIWHEPKGGENEVYQARADGTQAIVSGTFNKLVEYITSADFFDLHIRDVFLNTYTSFTTVPRLMEKLTQRYNTPPALNSTLCTLIQQRVFVFIKNWVKFEDENRLAGEFENTCDMFFSKHEGKQEFREIYQLYVKCIKEKPKPAQFHHNTQAPKSKLPKLMLATQKLTWWDIDELEIARQLSVWLFGQYSKIEHYEMLNLIWMKSPDKAPFLTEMISSFNKISKWVIGAILSERNLKNRAKMYTKMIKTTKHLADLNNYFAIMAFISGLNNAAISRLKYTKALVPSQQIETLVQMEKLMSMEGSFKQYRNTISDSSPPCIPYVGVHLSDLVFVAEGNPKTVGSRINVERLVLESNVITAVKRYQRIPYNLTALPSILEFFLSLPLMEEKESFDVSLQCEPRNGVPQNLPKQKTKEKERDKEKGKDKEKEKVKPDEEGELVLVAPDFWNLRGSHAHLMGLVDIGTHMSFIRLESGRFLVVDCVDVSSPARKREIDELTANGTLIEAVLCTHPFHTLYVPSFYSHYPNALYFGTPRHVRLNTTVTWAGTLTSSCNRGRWLPEVDMSIPDGTDFIAPLPEKTNHMSCVFVFHAKSRTIHVDDTIMIGNKPGVLLKLGGFKHGVLSFHPSIKGPGLHPTENAPFRFRDWIKGIIRNWDFDNICAAHMGNKIGGAKSALVDLLERSEGLFHKLSKRNTSVFTSSSSTDSFDLVAEGCECG